MYLYGVPNEQTEWPFSSLNEQDSRKSVSLVASSGSIKFCIMSLVGTWPWGVLGSGSGADGRVCGCDGGRGGTKEGGGT